MRDEITSKATMFLLIALAIANPVDAQQPAGPQIAIDPALDARVAEYLRPYVEMGHFAGLLLVARADSVLVHRAAGLADRELGVPFTIDARLRIGSITKDLTAALILSLQNEGVLSTDDPLAAFLPDFPNSDRILIQHLLTHRHGVPSWRELPEADVLGATGVSIEEATDILARQPLQFEPGSQFRYGSSGYLLLARVVEAATGESYEEALRRRILDPLGMRRTGSLRGLELVPGLADAYVPTGSPPWLEHYPPNHPAITVGSASAYSTALDLFRWSRSAPAQRVQWGQAEQHGREMLWTSGLTAGFTTRIHRFPEENVTLVYMSNVFTPAFRPILRGLAEMLFGADPEPLAAWTPVTLTPSDRSAFTGAWTCDTGFEAFEIEDRKGQLMFIIDGNPFPLIPREHDSLWLPTDYATLHLGSRGPDVFTEIRYEGGFATICNRP